MKGIFLIRRQTYLSACCCTVPLEKRSMPPWTSTHDLINFCSKTPKLFVHSNLTVIEFTRFKLSALSKFFLIFMPLWFVGGCRMKSHRFKSSFMISLSIIIALFPIFKETFDAPNTKCWQLPELKSFQLHLIALVPVNQNSYLELML